MGTQHTCTSPPNSCRLLIRLASSRPLSLEASSSLELPENLGLGSSSSRSRGFLGGGESGVCPRPGEERGVRGEGVGCVERGVWGEGGAWGEFE